MVTSVTISVSICCLLRIILIAFSQIAASGCCLLWARQFRVANAGEETPGNALFRIAAFQIRADLRWAHLPSGLRFNSSVNGPGLE